VKTKTLRSTPTSSRVLARDLKKRAAVAKAADIKNH
jgi:hypothetical protein